MKDLSKWVQSRNTQQVRTHLQKRFVRIRRHVLKGETEAAEAMLADLGFPVRLSSPRVMREFHKAMNPPTMRGMASWLEGWERRAASAEPATFVPCSPLVPNETTFADSALCTTSSPQDVKSEDMLEDWWQQVQQALIPGDLMEQFWHAATALEQQTFDEDEMNQNQQRTTATTCRFCGK